MEHPISTMDARIPPLPQPTPDQTLDMPSRKHLLAFDEDAYSCLELHHRQLKLPSYPPPSYTQLRDASLPFPDPQKAELAPIQPAGVRGDVNGHYGGNHQTLPSLSTITASTSSSPLSSSSPSAQPLASSSQRPPDPSYKPPAPPPPTHWPSLNPLTAYYTPSHVQNPEPPLRMDMDTSSNSVASTASPNRFHDGRASSVSLDDPDVRMAAEALGDLRADFVSSPIHRTTPPRSPRSLTMGQQTEPILQLLTTASPFLATTIDSATSAYTTSKNYYPRIKTSIEYFEGYVMPIAGSVGRVTGVENGVRWILRRAQPPDSDGGEPGSNKRRKVGPGDDHYRDGASDSGSGAQTPRASLEYPDDRPSSMDTLPAYDNFRSPPYTEQFPGSDSHPHRGIWHPRLIMSTSGLRIAMSEESLQRLRFCLGWIRRANVHIDDAITSLTTTLEKYEQKGQGSGEHGSSSNGQGYTRSQLAAQVRFLRDDVLKTLKEAMDTVSQYAGSALPENARQLVRHHMVSLPQRFHMASMASDREASHQSATSMEEGRSEDEQRQQTEMRESVRSAVIFAKEGLAMMSQVSKILNTTLESAEQWCETKSNKKKGQREGLLGVSSTSSDTTKSG